MKRFFIALFVFVLPMLVFSQPMDTTMIFQENFDGTTIKMNTTSSPTLGGTLGDWRVVGTGITYDNWNYLQLSKSAPNSYHSPIYSVAAFAEASTRDTIPLQIPGVQVNHVYLDFDHICKIHQLDYAAIYYQTVDSISANGNFYWSGWKILNFSNTSDFYYGDAKSTTGTAITGGVFNQASYTTWQSSDHLIQPTNAWWKHELIDISSFLFADGATPPYFQLKFRIRKTSPPGTGTENAAGWYVDNIKVILSNCELIKPTITMQSPYYYNTLAHFVNKTGPFPIKAKLYDNDTINLNAVQFSYEINGGNTVIVPNDGAFTNNTLNASGHNVTAQWEVPNICYQDTVYYHIYVEDTHGSNSRFDTFFVAHHNQQNIKYNDIDLDTINELPHCFITGTPQNIDLSFVNRSDAQNSPVTSGMTSGSFTMQVRDESGTITHNSTHNWSGDICFDVPSTISLGSFTPTHGYNYITIFVNSRNGQEDGYHANDTMRIVGYSCDSLLRGSYTVGGTNPDFADMEDVKRALEFCGLNGPVVFNLRAGTYHDFDFTKNYEGQSAVNTITFNGENVDNVIIVNNNADAGTSTYGAVTLVNVKDYIFKNLTIQGDNSATASRGVLVRGNGSTNITFDGCKFITYNTNSNSSASAAISRTSAASAPQASNAYPDTINIRNCKMIGGNFGVYYEGSNQKKNLVNIENCDISSCYRGIYTKYTNGYIKNNHIKQVDITNPQSFSGIYVNYVNGADIDGNTVDSVKKLEQAIYLGYATLEDYYVRNNHVIAGNGNLGIYITNSASSNTLSGNIYNNEVILYPITANNGYAFQINSSNNLNVINNSFLVKSDAPFNNSAAMYVNNGTGSSNVNISNNIFLNQVVCTNGSDYPVYFVGNASATGQYNDFNSTSGVVAYKTVARNSIAELQNAISTLTNSISLLPPFASTTSLLPTQFTGLECVKNDNVNADIRGVTRSSITYMGAYANAIPSVDAAVTALISPALGECPELSYDIAVEITNKGSEILNLASTNAKVAIYSQALNINQNVNINSGSVNPLQSVNKVLVQNVAIPVNQVIDFRFVVIANGDANHSNDTLVQYFTLETIMPDYVEDFSSGTQQTWTIEQLTGAGNWSFQSGVGENPAITPTYGTGRLFFNAKNFANNTSSRAILPVVTLTGSTNPIFEMWFAHDANTNKTKEGVVVKVSTDGGLTYTALSPVGVNDTLIKRYQSTATTPEWKLYTYYLQNYVSNNCIYIAIDATGQAGNNINIDRIRVRNLYDNDISVTKIYGHGETPMHYSVRDVVSAKVRNEGAEAQTNIPVYLHVVGTSEQWSDTLTIPSLAYQAETVVTFPDHVYNVAEVKDIEVRVANDDNNINNSSHWRMVTTQNAATIADTTTDIVMIGDYNNVIRPCVRYKTNEELSVTAVKYYYDQTYIADPENGFRAFVANADGQILATSEKIDFSTLQQGAWNTIPIVNFALTNTTGEFYVGLEMLSHGKYLCAQVETPLRDSTFYYLNNGTYVPQLSGLFMIGAVVDTPFVNDVAILELQHPVSNCDLGHEHLTVQLTNNGTTAIVPPIQLHYTVNGGTVVSENFTDTLQSHETTSFTFSSVYDFTNLLIDQDVNYSIKVWASKLEQDRLQYNDTLAEVVVSRGKANTPIAPASVVVDYHETGTLTAQLPASIPEGVIGWYTRSGYETWDFHGYGNSFTTPLIYFDTVYYVTANPGTVVEKTIGTGNTSETAPFVFDKGYSRGRMIYLDQEIGATGTIAQFALNVKTAMPATATDGIPMKIYMKTTTVSQFSSGSTNVNWQDELADATLVYDGRVLFDHTGWFDFNLSTPFEYNSGNLMVLTETFCADYCNGTGTQCNSCGVSVTGASISNLEFKSTSTTNYTVQSKGANTTSQLSSLSASKKRLNAKFTIVDLDCGSVKVPIQVLVSGIPNYDVETQELVYPTSGCAIYNENIQVQVKNMLNLPIPANKVVVHAVFNGTEITHTVADTFASEEVKIVTFSTPFDFSAPTSDSTFNYVIYTTLNNEDVVYAGNDTITGSFVSNKTAYMPDSIVYTGNYTQTFDILQPADRPDDISKFNFYRNYDDANYIFQTTNSSPAFTTPVLYDTVVYWASGQTGTGNNGCWTKKVKVIINVFSPEYDLRTDALLEPTSYQCGISSPNLVVQVANPDTTSNKAIPAGTFKLKADFTGAATVSGETTISNPISSLQQDTITFDNGINLGSATQNSIYQYLIYTQPVDASLPVYILNDTISGTIYIPATPVAPAAITDNVPYGGTYTVTPSTNPLNHFYFYANESDDQALSEGLTYTTEPIFAPTTYYYSGRVESEGFRDSLIVGTGGSNKTNPLNLGKAHSYAKIHYNKTDLGGVPARIDSIFFYVGKKENNGVGIPMKFWLKNGESKEVIQKSVNWNNETSSATLIYEGDIAWSKVGWVGFAINGGFNYEGDGLYLYVEHDCGEGGCDDIYGIDPKPQFKNSTTGSGKQKVVTYSKDDAIASSSVNFTQSTDRWNTKFAMNFTCESPKAPITINTTIPQHDVGVVEISAPVTQSNNYSDNETVTVKIMNYGTQSASNFPVSYQLDNETPVTQNYTGTIAAGATATLTFTTGCDLTSVYLPTPFKAYTGMTTDGYHNNDTLQITLSVEDPCISRPVSSSTGAHITNVTFAALDNGDGAPYINHPVTTGNGMYTDFTQTIAPTELILGQEYLLSITHAFTDTTKKTVYKVAYIDYNRDGSFGNTAPERLFPVETVEVGDSLAVTSFLITIPNDAEIGHTRMRVICATKSSLTPCAPYSGDGETEDYAILLSEKMDIDLGVSQIVHPVGEVCADENAKIRVKIKNYGNLTQTITPENPMTVTATVTGAATGTYSTTVNNGIITPNDEMMVVIDNVNLSQQGNYNVRIDMTYENDQYLTNNTRTGIGTVPTTAVWTLPYEETFNNYYNDGNPITIPNTWELDNTNNNYSWRFINAASPSSPTGGPEHDNTSAFLSDPSTGVYAIVQGINGSGNKNKVTNLTSGCINMHYNNGFPVEIYFHKFLKEVANSEFTLTVQTGSGSYYQDADVLTQADCEQTSVNDPWTQHVTVLSDVDEVARLRFKMTGQVGKIDPSIDDINVEIGYPDMAITQFVYPLHKDTLAAHGERCLEVNTPISPVITIKNNGYSPIESFDVVWEVSYSNNISVVTDHVDKHLEPGEYFNYTSENPFMVQDAQNSWSIMATVVIENDKYANNNKKRVLTCTTVSLPEYEESENVYLAQNQPNPSNTTTRIYYSVPETGKAVIEIVNPLGQTIYTTSQDAEVGNNFVDVDVSSWAAGIYYYTLKFNDVVLTKKMIVEK